MGPDLKDSKAFWIVNSIAAIAIFVVVLLSAHFSTAGLVVWTAGWIFIGGGFVWRAFFRR